MPRAIKLATAKLVPSAARRWLCYLANFPTISRLNRRTNSRFLDAQMAQRLDHQFELPCSNCTFARPLYRLLKIPHWQGCLSTGEWNVTVLHCRGPGLSILPPIPRQQLEHRFASASGTLSPIPRPPVRYRDARITPINCRGPLQSPLGSGKAWAINGSAFYRQPPPARATPDD